MKIFEQSFTISLDVARARRFRFVVKPNSPPARPMTTAPPPTKQWPHPAYLELDASGQAARYAPVGRCIYCGATEFIPGTSRALSEEHVIPEGLGAKLILPEASCKRCSNATTRFEGSVLRSLLWTARRHLKIPGKKRKREERLYPVTAIIDGNEVQFELPLPRYPVTLLLPELRRPGILSSRDSAAGGIRGIWVQKLNSFDGVSAAGIKEFAPPAIDTVRFCQLLAKTAHGFAVSQLGMDGFTPLLPEFICRHFPREDEYPECYHLIGGDEDDYAPNDALHIIGGLFWARAGKIYFVVEIRLFANLGAPIYAVTTGLMATPAQKELCRALTQAPEHTRDEVP